MPFGDLGSEIDLGGGSSGGTIGPSRFTPVVVGSESTTVPPTVASNPAIEVALANADPSAALATISASKSASALTRLMADRALSRISLVGTKPVPTPPIGRFGDVSTFVMNDEGNLDLDRSFGLIRAPIRILAEALARRLKTANGTLPYAPNFGTDLMDYLNGTESAFVIEQAIVAELSKDVRVESVVVNVTETMASSLASQMAIVAQVTLVSGETFALDIGVGDVTTSVLEA